MVAEQIIIRDACINDIAEMTVLINELGYLTSVNDFARRFELVSRHPDYKTFIALSNNEVVGMAGLCKGIFYERNGLYARIIIFVIKETYRKQGVGKLLVATSENWAVEQGLHTILVNSGNRNERKDAHAFYKRMGYMVKSSGFVKQL